jgi:predicted nucleotidyltransferase
VAINGLRAHRPKILELATRHGARNVRVFGSMARGDATPASDVDFLVDVEPGRTLLDVIALEQDLEDLLGRSVDVVTDGGLSPYLRARILAEAAALLQTTPRIINTSETPSRTSQRTAPPIMTRSSAIACGRTPR